MEQCPQCKENTLVHDGDEFGEYIFCLNIVCGYNDESKY